MTSRPNRILSIVVLVVAVIGVVAGVLVASRDVPTYDRRTPEGVVQAYVDAVIARDHDTAAAFLAEESSCTVDDLDRAFVPDGVRIVLRGTRADGGAAQVEVDVAWPSGGPLGGSEITERHTFRLRQADGDWRLTGQPWPMYDCGVR